MVDQPDDRYALFISYAEADRAWVQGFLLPTLGLPAEHTITPQEFRPGAARVDEFEQAVTSSRYTVLVLSPAYLADEWSMFGEQLASYTSVAEQRDRVIPLLLKACTLPLRVDFRVRLDCTEESNWEPEAARLRALLDQPGPACNLPRPACPYPGMRPFTVEESTVFFGRRQEVDDLLDRLRLHPFLTVIGRSGTGKSSLVFAGLVPALRKSTLFGAGNWLVRSMRPGETPHDTFLSLVQSDGVEPTSAAAQLLADAQATHLLLVIDQFEEVFTLATGSGQASAFQESLLRWINLPDCLIVLTVRADFYPDSMTCLLWPQIQAHRYEVLPLGRDGLREAVVRPAERAQAYVEQSLVERLLNDAADEPGMLPLVQETMVQLWEKLRRRFLAVNAYEEIGRGSRTGLQVAMATRADAAMRDLPSDSHRAVARRLVLRLIQFGQGRPDTRRQQRRSQLRSQGDDPAIFDQTLDHLINARLLVAGESEHQDPPVDIAHERLITGWPTLQQYLMERREAEQLRRRLEDKAQEWVRLGGSSGGLLDSVELLEAERWLAHPDAAELGHSDDLTALVQASRAAIERDEQEREAARQRELAQAQALAEEQQRVAEAQAKAAKRLRQGVLGLIILILIAFGAAGYAYRQQKRAEQQTALAQSRGLAAEAGNYLNKQLDLALLLSVEAHRKAETAEARQALYASLDVARSSIFLHGHQGDVWRLIFSPDGKTLASGGMVGTLLLWDLRGTPPGAIFLPGHQREVWSLAFSPDGQMLVSGDEKSTLLLWDLQETPPRATRLPGHQASVRALTFSPDGQQLASGDSDGTVFLWDLTVIPPRATPLLGYQHMAASLIFSPDGKTLTAVSHRGTALVWDLGITPPRATSLPSQQDNLHRFAVNPHSKTLAFGGPTGTLLLWDLRMTPPARTALPGHQDNVRALAFNSSGNILASGDQSSTLLLWDLRVTPPRSISLSGHQDGIYSLAFGPDGQTLASGDGRGRLLLWDLRGSEPRATLLPGHQGGILQLAFSPDGHALVSGDNMSTFLLWDLRMTLPHVDRRMAPPRSTPFASLPTGLRTLSFSPDGKTLAAVDYTGTFVVEDLSASAPIRNPLPGHRGGQLLFSPDGKTLVTGGGWGTLLLWDLRETPPRSTFLPGHRGPVDELALSPDAKWLASGDGNRTLLLWDLRGSPPRPTALSGHQANVWRLRFSPDGKWLASSDGSSLLLWDLHVPHPQSLPLAGHQGHVQTFTFSPDGKTLASGGTAGTLLLWDLRRAPPIATPLPGHLGGVSVLAFSPDEHEKMLVSGDDKSTLLLWDLRGTSPRFTVLPSHPGYRRTFTFSPDGKTLALGNNDGSLLLWDLTGTPHRATSLTGHHGGVRALTFSPDGKTLASGDMAGTLRLWDRRVKPPRSILLPGYRAAASPIGGGPSVGVREFTFSPDGKILAASPDEGPPVLWDLRMTPPVSLRLSHDQRNAGTFTFSPDSKTLASGTTLWNVDFDSWPPHACRIANRNLTCTEWAQFMKDEPYRPTCAYLPFEACEGGLTGIVTLE